MSRSPADTFPHACLNNLYRALANLAVTDFTNHVEIHLERDIGGKQREGKVFKEEHDEETHEATSATEEKQLEAGAQV
jgi:hypothetical protein